MVEAIVGTPHKLISDAPKFLVESGLLFEINRNILHPLGLALALHVDATGKLSKIEIWDIREDPEGFVFDADSLKVGEAKLAKFMDVQGNEIVTRRKDKLGFVYQFGAPKGDRDA